MRLVAVSIVKNEADIIEAFVRHTAYWVDHHLIFDHQSTDGTKKILQALQHEKLPITLYRDEAWGHLQQRRSNYLTRLAAQTFEADWVLPLDTDEILVGADRQHLESHLESAEADTPMSLRLCDYYPSHSDDTTEINPVCRLRYSQQALSQTKKLFIPRSLALDEQVVAVKGSHVLNRTDQPLPDRPLPEEFHLAHLALRSPQHQVLRVITAELNKLSNGRAAEGLDTHYRLGYQLLAENPEMFFSTLCPPAHRLHLRPINYRGDSLKYSQQSAGWNRLSQALLPVLEHLAISHGKLLDGEDSSSTEIDHQIREITPAPAPPQITSEESARFTGFTSIKGWGVSEGPVPEAFLPSFHWGHFPNSQLQIDAQSDQVAHLDAEVLTYSEGQSITISLNDVEVGSLAFTRINQKETLSMPISLKSGRNILTFKYSQYLATDYDARQLAVLFLSLRINGTD